MVVSRLKRYVCVAVVASSCVSGAFGENTPVDSDPERDDQAAIDELESDADGSIDDAEGSIEDATAERGLVFGGDVRLSYAYEDLDTRNSTSINEDQLRSRWRIDAKWGIAEYLRVAGRVAGICSTNGCDPDFIVQPEIPTAASIDDGQITFDELFLHWFRLERFDLAVGRMQTKFVARGGVYAKSLDRNDSNNLRVTETSTDWPGISRPALWISSRNTASASITGAPRPAGCCLRNTGKTKSCSRFVISGAKAGSWR